MHATHPQAGEGPRRGWSWSSLVLLAGLVLAYLVFLDRGGHSQPGTEGPAIGRRLIHFRLEPLTGASKAVSLDDLSGDVTLVNFWGTWCGPCQLELPHIVDLAVEFGDRQDFNLYAVSCGHGSDEDLEALRTETQEFLDANKTTLPTYADQGARTRQSLSITLGRDPQEFSYPTTIVFDHQGAIRGFWQGYSGAAVDEMKSLVRELLRQGSAEAGPNPPSQG